MRFGATTARGNGPIMTAAEKIPTEVAAGPERNLIELLLTRVREARSPAATHKIDGRWVDVILMEKILD